MTPLDEFVARWNAKGISVPFVEVVNTPVTLDEVPDRWGSALMHGDQRRDVSLGSNPWVEEIGTIVVGLFARSGSGRHQLNQAVDELRAVFHGWQSPDKSIHFTSVNGPEDIDPEGAGEWWRLGLTVPYIVQSRRVEPVP